MRLPIMLISAFAFAAAPAAAATYVAKPAAAAPNSHIVARDINWSCSTDTCQGATAESRPAVLCQALAKRAGRIDSFLVDGRAFTTAELDKCNAAAKGEPSKALAAQ
jgi:hypothetical protein